MKVGDRVLVHEAWSSFQGQRGEVTQTKPFLMVLLDDESRPMRFGDSEVIAVDNESTRHVAGAE